MTEFVTSKDGARIAYEKVGSGPALVLVDGAMCYRDFGPCRSAATAFSDRYTVYFYDRRGRGESGDSPEYAPEREYEDLAAVIDATGEEAYVLGYSSGGALGSAPGVRVITSMLPERASGSKTETRKVPVASSLGRAPKVVVAAKSSVS